MAHQLELLDHEYRGQTIRQRTRDGYVNATAMCRAAGREWSRYRELKSTNEFFRELARDLQLEEAQLTQTILGTPGGDARNQGTWVHPQIAINLAQWLSPQFAVKVTQWVYDWMSSGPVPAAGKMPYHLRRYVANQRNVPPGHFSILNEITLALIGPLEAEGYTLPEKLWPDISEGKIFAKWVRDQYGVDTTALPTYAHVFEDGRPTVQARAWPNEWLPEFRRHFAEVWLPQRAQSYFQERDVKALAFLPKLLPAPDNS